MEHASITANPESTTFTTSTFKVLLSLTETSLAIQAEQFHTLKRFQAIIAPDDVKNITSNLFPDLESLYLGLMDAFENIDSSVTVTVSDVGVITYSWEKILREKKKITGSFTIALEEQADPTKSQGSLDIRKFVELEKRIEVIERENMNLKTNMDKLITEKIEELSSKMLKRVQETTMEKTRDLIDKEVNELRHEAVINVKKNLDQVKKLEEEIKKQSDKIIELEESLNTPKKLERRPSTDSDLAIFEKLTMIENTLIPKISESNNTAICMMDEMMKKRIDDVEHVIIPKVIESYNISITRLQEILGKKIADIEEQTIPKAVETVTTDLRKTEDVLKRKILDIENEVIPEVRKFNYVAINTVETSLAKKILAVEIVKIPKLIEEYTNSIARVEENLTKKMQVAQDRIETKMKELSVQTPGYQMPTYVHTGYSVNQQVPPQVFTSYAFAPHDYAPNANNADGSNKSQVYNPYGKENKK